MAKSDIGGGVEVKCDVTRFKKLCYQIADKLSILVVLYVPNDLKKVAVALKM